MHYMLFEENLHIKNIKWLMVNLYHKMNETGNVLPEDQTRKQDKLSGQTVEFSFKNCP